MHNDMFYTNQVSNLCIEFLSGITTLFFIDLTRHHHSSHGAINGPQGCPSFWLSSVSYSDVRDSQFYYSDIPPDCCLLPTTRLLHRLWQFGALQLQGSTVLTATATSQWSRAKFDPHRIETPKPIAKKFGTVDYVREATQCAKFRANPPTGTSRQIRDT